jgi:predicted RNA-binding Zn ribbon-like protein
MLQTETDAGGLELVGGDLSLDFANTVGSHNSDAPNEHLTSYRALIAWSRHTRILSNRSAQRMLDQAEHRNDEAQRVLERASVLREAIYRIFSAVSEGGTPAPADLDILNETLSAALAHACVVPTRQGFTWGWVRDDEALDQMLWYVARSAADLLTSRERSKVRECANTTCGWLFVDTSKNHSRRWCSMSDCGNRAKARRHYARLRAAK